MQHCIKLSKRIPYIQFYIIYAKAMGFVAYILLKLLQKGGRLQSGLSVLKTAKQRCFHTIPYIQFYVFNNPLHPVLSFQQQ